jgi:hypothetical protein
VICEPGLVVVHANVTVVNRGELAIDDFVFGGNTSEGVVDSINGIADWGILG